MRRWWAGDHDGRIMALDRSAVAAKAEERAEALLASLLDADDAERWRLDRRIFIPDDYTRNDLGFTIYVVAHNVYVVYGPRLIDEQRCPVEPICTHSDPGLPLADRVATYVLLIRADLQGALAPPAGPPAGLPVPVVFPRFASRSVLLATRYWDQNGSTPPGGDGYRGGSQGRLSTLRRDASQCLTTIRSASASWVLSGRCGSQDPTRPS